MFRLQICIASDLRQTENNARSRADTHQRKALCRFSRGRTSSYKQPSLAMMIP